LLHNGHYAIFCDTYYFAEVDTVTGLHAIKNRYEHLTRRITCTSTHAGCGDIDSVSSSIQCCQ
jgi:hypothetical protein